MTDYAMIIDGNAVKGTTFVSAINPATGQEFARVPDCTTHQLDRAMAAAAGAVRGWASHIEHRQKALAACAALVEARQPELAALLTQEQGKPLHESAMEIRSTIEWLSYYSKVDLPVEVLEDSDTRRVELHRRPLGVVAAITPWNYPLLLAVWKIAPALLAGNAVVLKPSPFTPVTALVLADMFREVLPPGIFSVVTGSNELGAAITHHPIPRKLSLTGSVATGKAVMAAAATDLKRVTLELGGNDAAIVLADVHPKAIATKLFWRSFFNNGQICSAIKRLFVHESIFAETVSELATIARSVKVGNGLEKGTQIGPINNARQLDRIIGLVEDARERRATIVTGGERIGQQGYFFAPTIVTDIDDDARLVAEEQFGPVLPVLAYRDVTDAIRRANSTSYALSGSVWSSDRAKAVAVAGELECGTVWVNQHLAFAPSIPFAGMKASGIGVENGSWGLHELTGMQILHIAKE